MLFGKDLNVVTETVVLRHHH